MGRKEHCKQITLACAHSVPATLALPPLTGCVLSLSTLLRLWVALLELSEEGPGLYELPRSKPLRFRHSVVLRGADSVGPAFCALPRSEQLR